MFHVDENQFEYVKPLTWEDVFGFWRENEAASPAWEEHWRSRGFNSWEEWRQQYAGPFKCADRQWHLYRVVNPLESVPNFHGGPFRNWVEKYYEGEKAPQFSKLAQTPYAQQHEPINNLLENFPEETKITGLVQNGEVIIIEGTHRCIAVARAAHEGKRIETTIYIAVADASGEDLPIVGGFQKKS